jgi:serine/threonine-protein kinase
MDSRADPFGLVGQVLDGQFRVERHVGEGGFSVVYKGTHVGLGEPIAVKCLKLPLALGSALVETFVQRFRDESRLHYKLSQGNLHIARSIASGTTMAPATSALVPYTVLEWLDGRSLAEELNERRAQGGTGRPMAEVVRLFDSAVDALAYAHSQGVVHRDLNPGNFFLARTPAGPKLKVLDFGVAKVLADSTLAMGHAARTLGNIRMFAPAYGAPEQFDDRLGPIGPYTDVYALVLVLIEALSDRGVVEGEHIGEFAMQTLDAARRPTPRAFGVAVGDAVEAIFARASALRPTDRPRDAGELWGMLKNAMRTDAESGGRSHAARAGSLPATPAQSPPAATLRMEQLAGFALPPVIEVPRSAASTGAVRQHGGTLRMERPAARSGVEALGATPFPANVDIRTPEPQMTPFASREAPHARTLPIAGAARPAPAPARMPSAGAAQAPTPLPALAAHAVAEALVGAPGVPRSRTPRVAIAVGCVVALAAIAAGSWFAFAR